MLVKNQEAAVEGTVGPQHLELSFAFMDLEGDEVKDLTLGFTCNDLDPLHEVCHNLHCNVLYSAQHCLIVSL